LTGSARCAASRTQRWWRHPPSRSSRCRVGTFDAKLFADSVGNEIQANALVAGAVSLQSTV
jgi:hypothetical protein